ncbi:Uncharacterised protein [Vibrio cholerae]|nr:Uncharacterised protein [Vibrio cholerae]
MRQQDMHPHSVHSLSHRVNCARTNRDPSENT